MKFEFSYRSIPKNSFSFQDGNGCLSKEEFLQGANFTRRFGHFHQHPLSSNIRKSGINIQKCHK